MGGEGGDGVRLAVSGEQADHYLIPLGRTDYCAKVSPEDYEFLSRWKWCIKRSDRRYAYAIYARRAVNVGEHTITIYMHHVVLERMGQPRPDDKHDGHHINKDPLDNRRGNLAWSHQSKNRATNCTAYAMTVAL